MMDNIRVAVRVRPPLEHERNCNSFEKLQVDHDQKLVKWATKKFFDDNLWFSAYNERTKGYKNAQFDIVFDNKANQGQIF